MRLGVWYHKGQNLYYLVSRGPDENYCFINLSNIDLHTWTGMNTHEIGDCFVGHEHLGNFHDVFEMENT